MKRFSVVAALLLVILLTDCVGVAKARCLQVRDQPGDPWQYRYGGIDGFTHRIGTTFTLRIRVERIADTPADGPANRWGLEQVLGQRIN